MKTTRRSLNHLHDLLVEQFRAFQALAQILESERRALNGGDEALLQTLGLQKERLLERLERLESERQASLRALAEELGIDPAQGKLLAQVCRALPQDSAEPLERLQQGIYMLLQSLHETTMGNRALARQALARAVEQQTQLVGLFEPGAWKQPAGEVSRLPSALASLVEARNALANEVHAGHNSLAANHLNLALEQFSLVLGTRGGRGKAGEAQASPGLVETIAGLYRQSCTYRAVVQACERTLHSL
ncbi:MAG: flagellar export chaperone FlgN [Chloroflexota bacterium]